MPKFSLHDPIEVTVRRARFLYHLVIAGIIYTMLLTAGAGYAVYSLYNRQEDSCSARQTSRTAYRLILSRDEDWDAADQELLDANLPAQVTC